MGKKQQEDYAKSLEESFGQWEYLLNYGGSDPFWPDGTNMNLVRNRICYYRGKLEEQYGEDKHLYPEVYFREVPPEMEHDYLANVYAIREGAKEKLEAYLENEDLQYLVSVRDVLTANERKRVCIDAVIGYAVGLAHAIRDEDIVTMRRHAKSNGHYQESFRECTGKIRELKDKEWKEGEQLTLLSVMEEQSR